ncbi:MAG TPA: tetratricopeptide repeat protein [Bryobacteraceae bacterium]|nr:tetratricopeptide repeat protein [Bryobacteraceae bacterium]
MRHLAACLVLPFGLCMLSGLPAYAQNKAACELVSKGDAEAILGVPLLPPKPSEPFRSLLDPDFTSGTPEQGCEFTNFNFKQPKPPKVVNVRLEVRYSSTPNARAVDEARKQVDTRTYDHPTGLPGLGDAAFWIGPPNNVTVFVFLGGTTRLMIGPSEIGLEQEKALAAKALAALGKTTFTYGTQPTGLHKPALSKLGPTPSGIEQLKHALTAKADAGDTKAQIALGKLYESGNLGQDGKVQHDYAGAAYWYHQASDHGEAQAAYELAILYHEGLGVAADASQSFQLLQKAAEAKYVPAMPLLSNAYADQKTSVSRNRATYWATQAAEAGDPKGWLILGFEYNSGLLGGNRPYWYTSAMEAFRKAAAGGNCLAMMEIGELYSNGNGVPADKTLAQSWEAKAQSCQDGNLALLQQQLTQFRARAAAAREPMLDAIPVIPKTAPPVARNGRRSGVSGDSDVLASIAAAVAVVAAITALIPPTANAGSPPSVALDLCSITECRDASNRPYR